VFDPVAKAMIDAGARPELKTAVLTVLIAALQERGWDTEGESLGDFSQDEAVVAAFRANGVVIECGAEGGDAEDCTLEREHAGNHRGWRGGTWPQEIPPAAGSTHG
jgi:hypothetical protein